MIITNYHLIRRLALHVLALYGVTISLRAQEVAGPGWIVGEADPVSPEAAAQYFEAKANRMAQAAPRRLAMNGAAGGPAAAPGEPAPANSSATEQTPEIVELARGLEHDPKLIFDHVHNHIDYSAYFGSLKGATLTLLDGSGNDFDQASLLIALLRASGYSAQYQYGTMTIPRLELQNWGGSVDNWLAVFANGGVPINYADNYYRSATLNRVWVKATINGVDHAFDPAFKLYESSEKINFAQAMGYNRDQLITAAGGTFTADYCQNLNENGLRTKLTEYTSNLVASFRNQHPNKSLSELLGRRRIVHTELSSLPVALPYAPVVQENWDEIPEAYATTMHIVYSGIDATFRTTEVATKRFTLTYGPGDFRPKLTLEGGVVAMGSPTVPGSVASMSITVDHPFGANNGTYGDQAATFAYKSGGVYALCSDFGGRSEQLIRKRQRAMDLARAQGATEESESVRGETLHLIGLEYFKEVNSSRKLLCEVGAIIPTTLHNIGRVAQESGYYVDMWFSYTSVVKSSANSANANALNLASDASSFEHAVLEQLMGTSNPGVSTVKLLQMANSSGQKVFNVTPGNFAVIRPQLSRYTDAELNGFQTQFTAGTLTRLILPADGLLVSNAWKGHGYVRITATDGIGWTISGNLFGGYSSDAGFVDPDFLEDNMCWDFSPDTRATISHVYSQDPVEMGSGAFTFNASDLAFGGPSLPLMMGFGRSYSSSQNLDEGSIGKGWRHCYDIRVKKVTRSDLGLGARLPVEAAAMIVYSWANLDILGSGDDLQRWMVSILSAKWATDTLTQNAVAVYSGHQLSEFVKLPDGSYSAPPGSTDRVVQNPFGVCSIIERFGTRYDFGNNERIAKITDVDGNEMNFSYAPSPSTRLTGVTDAFGRSLTFSYTGDRITSVADSTGRSVSYGYDEAGNLGSYTDADGKVWAYTYDAEHRMTALSDPLGVTTARMTYDSTGKVATQTTPRQGGANATYDFHFSGFRSVERDPTGATTVHFFDDDGKPLGMQDALGGRTSVTYDGQNHVVKSTDARGHTTTSVYDGNHNIIGVLDALGNASTLAYDSQFRLIEKTDPLGNKSQIAYDAKHHVVSTRDPESNQVSNTWLPNGFLHTTTNPLNTVAISTYDAAGNLASLKVAAHPPVNYGYDSAGRMTSLTDQVNATVHLGYNNRDLLTKKTDRLGKDTLNTYDDAGRLLSSTDRKGVTTRYTYTPSGKTAGLTAPGVSVAYSYDIRDNLVAMQDGIGTTTYTYDELNRVVSMTDSHGFTVGYGYDAAGNLATLTYPGGKQVIYTYDALNRLVGVDTWLEVQKTATFVYDAAGRLIRTNQFNGTYACYSYDRASRLTALENRRTPSDSICFYRFTLDGNGNRTKIVQSEPLRTLIEAESTDYTYNAQKNRLLAAGLTAFTYDEEGQLAAATNIPVGYTFDSLHRLTGVSGPQAFQFTFCGANHRLRAVREGVETRYIYDTRGNILAEADASNTITRYYIHGLGLMAAITPAAELYCYHFNAIGSTIAVTDSGKNIVNAYSYSPFGRVVDSRKSFEQPFAYVGAAGVLADSDTLYHMRARAYDSKVGRFISEDPIQEAGGINLYSYATNNPINWNDPLGLKTMVYSHEGATEDALWAEYNQLWLEQQKIEGRLSQLNPERDMAVLKVATIPEVLGAIARDPAIGDAVRDALNSQINDHYADQKTLQRELVHQKRIGEQRMSGILEKKGFK